MTRSFFFFELDLPEGVEDIPPLYGETVSDIERHLTEQGIEIVKLRREFLKGKTLYDGSIYGVGYRYGYFVDGDFLVFLFSIPLSLKLMESKPLKVREKIRERLREGFIEREFYKLDGFQFAELIAGRFYVGTEW
ncbi:hypothetical protein [Hydrogenivirga sp.]